MKKFVIRLICCLLAVIMTAGLLSACGTAKNETGNTETTGKTESATSAATVKTTEPKKSVTISVSAFTGQITDIEKNLAATYEKESGNKIDFQIIVADQYAAIVKSKFAAGEGPDIAYLWVGASALQFQPSKNFLDLSNEPWVVNYKDEAKKSATYDGKVLAFNTSSISNGWGIWYNKILFEKYGLTPPKTFEEFTNVCETLKKNNVRPIFLAGKEEWAIGLWLSQMAALVEKRDPAYLDKLNAGQATFAEAPELVTFMEQFKVLYDKGYLGTSALADTWANSNAALNDDKAAMFMTCDAYWNIASVVEGLPKHDTVKDFGMIPIPMAGNRYIAAISGGVGQFINKKSKNLEAAKDYINFLAREDNLKAYYAATPRYQGNPDFKNVQAVPDANTDAMTAFSEGIGNCFEFGAAYWDNALVGKYMTDLVMGKKTPKQVLEALDADRLKLIKAIMK